MLNVNYFNGKFSVHFAIHVLKSVYGKVKLVRRFRNIYQKVIAYLYMLF